MSQIPFQLRHHDPIDPVVRIRTACLRLEMIRLHDYGQRKDPHRSCYSLK